MTGLEVGVLVLIAGWNLVSYWPVLTATLPAPAAEPTKIARVGPRLNPPPLALPCPGEGSWRLCPGLDLSVR